ASAKDSPSNRVVPRRKCWTTMAYMRRKRASSPNNRMKHRLDAKFGTATDLWLDLRVKCFHYFGSSFLEPERRGKVARRFGNCTSVQEAIFASSKSSTQLDRVQSGG